MSRLGDLVDEEESNIEKLEEAMEGLREMPELSAAIGIAKNGDERSLRKLREPRTVESEFPGSRTRAMSHALVIEEDLDDLGIAAERAYVGETKMVIKSTFTSPVGSPPDE